MQCEDLGKFLRLKRLNEKISLNRFAIENDIDSATLSRIERCLQEIKLSTFLKIASGYNMIGSDLLKEFETYVNKI